MSSRLCPHFWLETDLHHGAVSQAYLARAASESSDVQLGQTIYMLTELVSTKSMSG